MKENKQSLFTQTNLESFLYPLLNPFKRWPRTSDTVLALFVFVFSLVASKPGQELPLSSSMAYLGLVGHAVACGALIYRRRFPHIVLATVSLASVILWGLSIVDGPGFAMVIALFSLGRYAENDTINYGGVLLSIAFLGIGNLLAGTTIDNNLVDIFTALLIWYVGRRIRVKQRQREQDQAFQQQQALTEERARIARELHDIVAHQVSLMTVQAGAAKMVLESNPSAARESLRTIEQSGRQAMVELRHLLGVLRRNSVASDFEPQPGLANLDELANNLEQSGIPVTLAINLDDKPIDAHIELTVYRIVQEAFTNSLKHAGTNASVNATIQDKNNYLEVEVIDTGDGSGRMDGTGHGILGMQERVSLLGGTLTAEPNFTGGFTVFARLPLKQN